MFKKILVPLDGSELAEWALTPALALAKATQGEVILLRSMIPVYTTMPMVADEYSWVWPDYAREQGRAETRTYLEDIARTHSHPSITLHPMAVEGDAAGMIVDTAVAEDIDLIVMSTHGWSGFKKWLLGSVTERVLHSVSCPVLAVRSSQPIRRMLITLDGSPLAEKAVAPALAVAAGLEAKVVLLHVNEPIIPGYESTFQFEWSVAEDQQQQLHHERQGQAETYLNSVAHQYGRDDVEMQQMVISGAPVETILEFMRLHSMDLVAMSTHGRSGLRRWLYGSVTAKVMRGSESHMLIVRPPNGELVS
ncbi:MAG TPA: universal stress protein [Chloroflexota bacterium]|nr:universal stress protein [Chloroflexota bacterium]HUM72401.1 universal stress protein [Chloroflexota bacterium]